MTLPRFPKSTMLKQRTGLLYESLSNCQLDAWNPAGRRQRDGNTGHAHLLQLMIVLETIRSEASLRRDFQLPRAHHNVGADYRVALTTRLHGC
jgi:hypothetical protein